MCLSYSLIQCLISLHNERDDPLLGSRYECVKIRETTYSVVFCSIIKDYIHLYVLGAN